MGSEYYTLRQAFQIYLFFHHFSNFQAGNSNRRPLFNIPLRLFNVLILEKQSYKRRGEEWGERERDFGGDFLFEHIYMNIKKYIFS